MHSKKYIKKALIVLLTLITVFSSVAVSGSAAAPTNNTVKTIYNFLIDEMGLNSAAACGVLANIEKESDFNPQLYGDNGTSYGICQWHNGRFDNLKSYCNKNGYSWKTLEGQLHFLKYELETQKSTTGYILDKLDVPNTAQGAYTAGYNWCYYFERPSNKTAKSETRGTNARDVYWPVYKLVYNLGDVNSDGKINSADALQVLEYSVGSLNLNLSQKKAGDLDKNGKVNSQDALIILSVSAGKVSINNYK
ncbi:MAG: hypothetical protein J6L62_04505 [Clostridia bacterium]|nr:hypothetical protein [Clostridia bacterium]